MSLISHALWALGLTLGPWSILSWFLLNIQSSTCRYPVFPAVFIEEAVIFHHMLLVPFCQKSVGFRYVGFYLLGCLFYSIGSYVQTDAGTTLFWLLWLCTMSCIQSSWCLLFVLYPHGGSAESGLLWFHMNFFWLCMCLPYIMITLLMRIWYMYPIHVNYNFIFLSSFPPLFYICWPLSSFEKDLSLYFLLTIFVLLFIYNMYFIR